MSTLKTLAGALRLLLAGALDTLEPTALDADQAGAAEAELQALARLADRLDTLAGSPSTEGRPDA